MSSQANCRNTFFNQKSPQHREVVFSDKQTDRHADSKTKLAQGADSVGKGIYERALAFCAGTAKNLKLKAYNYSKKTK